MKVQVRLTTDPRPLPDRFTGIIIPPGSECYIYRDGKQVKHLNNLDDATAFFLDLEDADVEEVSRG